MSAQMCLNCNKLLREGDKVRATVLSYFKGLKSQVHYAIEQPYACEKIEHINCNWPKGDIPNGDAA